VLQDATDALPEVSIRSSVDAQYRGPLIRARTRSAAEPAGAAADAGLHVRIVPSWCSWGPSRSPLMRCPAARGRRHRGRRPTAFMPPLSSRDTRRRIRPRRCHRSGQRLPRRSPTRRWRCGAARQASNPGDCRAAARCAPPESSSSSRVAAPVPVAQVRPPGPRPRSPNRAAASTPSWSPAKPARRMPPATWRCVRGRSVRLRCEHWARDRSSSSSMRPAEITLEEPGWRCTSARCSIYPPSA